MDQLAFEVTRVGPEMAAASFAILINGRRLESLAEVVERPFAVGEGKPQLAGDYEPSCLIDFDSDVSHFLGRPVASWFGDADAVLMGCGCGVWGCWPLTAQTVMREQSVVWLGFRNGHRDWDLRDLGPFTFDRSEYELALTALN